MDGHNPVSGQFDKENFNHEFQKKIKLLNTRLRLNDLTFQLSNKQQLFML